LSLDPEEREVEEVPIPAQEEAHDAFKDFQAMFDGPAFVRRARSVEGALQDLLERCRRKRDEWLPMVRLRLGILHALVVGDWTALRPFLASDEKQQHLAHLYEELRPTLRAPIAPTTSERRLRQALGELRESIALFNRRWTDYLPTVDLTHVNELRDGYNRYFVLEKECAVRSARVARQGFVRLEPLTVDEILRHLPLLPAV
jgi:hypothetical protein